MKKLLILSLVLLCAFAKAETASIAIQEFVSHQVEAGETVYSISKKYNLSEKQILKLNPDAKKSIYEGLVLILPSGSKVKSTTSGVVQEDIKFKKHKVRRKETLYSISKKYGVSQDAIKRFNKELYSQPLRKGDRIRIPLNFVEVTETMTSGGGISVDNAPSDGAPYSKHLVKAKETKYGVARMYGITIAELEAMNPGMGLGLQEGTSINVPKEKVSDSAIIETDSFEFYEVQKGDTMYSLLGRLNMKADELVILNPALDNGLKEGMILKIPKQGMGNVDDSGTVSVNGETMSTTSLADSLVDFSKKKIAVLMPFGLKRMDTDTLVNDTDIVRSDRVLRLSLDFYSGVLMAVEAAKAKGISVDLDVYDTDYVRADGVSTNARKVENIIMNNDFSDVDVVIGPLLGDNVNRAATVLNNKGIPMISPIWPKVKMGQNVFQSRPSDRMLRDIMLAYIKANYSDQNIIIIADGKNGQIKTKLKGMFPNAKEVNPRSGEKGLYLYPDDIPNQISDTKENWVILETNDIPLISNVTTNLNAQAAINKVTLFTTNKGSAYDSDEIQHMHLMNLAFHFPSIDNGAINEDTEAFNDAYEDRFGVSPGRFATRGYDITYDTLLRLGFAKDLFTAAALGIETSYIENKFQYSKSAFGGFENRAVYLMKYAADLQLVEVKLNEVALD